jgi:hypothetical protein
MGGLEADPSTAIIYNNFGAAIAAHREEAAASILPNRSLAFDEFQLLNQLSDFAYNGEAYRNKNSTVSLQLKCFLEACERDPRHTAAYSNVGRLFLPKETAIHELVSLFPGESLLTLVDFVPMPKEAIGTVSELHQIANLEVVVDRRPDDSRPRNDSVSTPFIPYDDLARTQDIQEHISRLRRCVPQAEQCSSIARQFTNWTTKVSNLKVVFNDQTVRSIRECFLEAIDCDDRDSQGDPYRLLGLTMHAQETIKLYNGKKFTKKMCFVEAIRKNRRDAAAMAFLAALMGYLGETGELDYVEIEPSVKVNRTQLLMEAMRLHRIPRFSLSFVEIVRFHASPHQSVIIPNRRAAEISSFFQRSGTPLTMQVPVTMLLQEILSEHPHHPLAWHLLAECLRGLKPLVAPLIIGNSFLKITKAEQCHYISAESHNGLMINENIQRSLDCAVEQIPFQGENALQKLSWCAHYIQDLARSSETLQPKRRWSLDFDYLIRQRWWAFLRMRFNPKISEPSAISAYTQSMRWVSPRVVHPWPALNAAQQKRDVPFSPEYGYALHKVSALELPDGTVQLFHASSRFLWSETVPQDSLNLPHIPLLTHDLVVLAAESLDADRYFLVSFRPGESQLQASCYVHSGQRVWQETLSRCALPWGSAEVPAVQTAVGAHIAVLVSYKGSVQLWSLDYRSTQAFRIQMHIQLHRDISSRVMITAAGPDCYIINGGIISLLRDDTTYSRWKIPCAAICCEAAVVIDTAPESPRKSLLLALFSERIAGEKLQLQCVDISDLHVAEVPCLRLATEWLRIAGPSSSICMHVCALPGRRFTIHVGLGSGLIMQLDAVYRGDEPMECSLRCAYNAHAPVVSMTSTRRAGLFVATSAGTALLWSAEQREPQLLDTNQQSKIHN